VVMFILRTEQVSSLTPRLAEGSEAHIQVV